MNIIIIKYTIYCGTFLSNRCGCRFYINPCYKYYYICLTKYKLIIYYDKQYITKVSKTLEIITHIYVYLYV